MLSLSLKGLWTKLEIEWVILECMHHSLYFGDNFASNPAKQIKQAAGLLSMWGSITTDMSCWWSILIALDLIFGLAQMMWCISTWWFFFDQKKSAIAYNRLYMTVQWPCIYKLYKMKKLLSDSLAPNKLFYDLIP